MFKDWTSSYRHGETRKGFNRTTELQCGDWIGADETCSGENGK